MKKLLLICALSALVSNGIVNARAVALDPYNDRRVVWFDKNDITKGGVFTFVKKNSADKREMGAAIPAGTKDAVLKQVQAFQAEFPVTEYVAP